MLLSIFKQFISVLIFKYRLRFSSAADWFNARTWNRRIHFTVRNGHGRGWNSCRWTSWGTSISTSTWQQSIGRLVWHRPVNGSTRSFLMLFRIIQIHIHASQMVPRLYIYKRSYYSIVLIFFYINLPHCLSLYHNEICSSTSFFFNINIVKPFFDLYIDHNVAYTFLFIIKKKC